MLPAQQQSNSLPIYVCPSGCRLMRECVVRWFDIELNFWVERRFFLLFLISLSLLSFSWLYAVFPSAESQTKLRLWGGLQVTLLCVFFSVCIFMSNPACIVFILLVRRFITAGFVANVLVSWFFSMWRFSRKTLEWNLFVSWVTSFPSLSFCPYVPKHDTLFIYFLTQVQLVLFEKFIRQRELCAMIL